VRRAWLTTVSQSPASNCCSLAGRLTTRVVRVVAVLNVLLVWSRCGLVAGARLDSDLALEPAAITVKVGGDWNGAYCRTRVAQS
jgi:hypothetical protein